MAGTKQTDFELIMTQTSVLVPIDRPKHLEADHRASGRIIKSGSQIKSISDIEEIEQQWATIYANRYERFVYNIFGGWRKESTPVSRETILQACLCQF